MVNTLYSEEEVDMGYNGQMFVLTVGGKNHSYLISKEEINLSVKKLIDSRGGMAQQIDMLENGRNNLEKALEKAREFLGKQER